MNSSTKTIIKEIGSYRFPGFYESVFCYSDEFIDIETELKNYLQEKIDENIDVYYEYDNFKEYMKDICISYMDKYVEKLKDILPYDISEDDDFLFDIVDKEDVVIVSPKYYNFSTDRCYCDIKTNFATLNNIKKYALKLKGAEEYIRREFSSRDGFISFINPDIKYWIELPIEKYEQNMLISLLDMLFQLSDNEAFFDIKFDVCEDITKICYAHPVVVYKKKEYHLGVKNEQEDEDMKKIMKCYLKF